jgi:hypothetical protein
VAAGEHNANNAAIAAVLNGNIDANNIKDASITTAKLATGLSPANMQAVGAFRAQLSSDQAIASASTDEKILFDSEDFDISSYYDNASNYRFTPTTAGIYKVSAGVNWDSSNSSGAIRQINMRKNSTDGTDGTVVANATTQVSNATRERNTHVSTLVSLNGSTDYIEIYANSSNAADDVQGGTGITYFEAHLVGTT